MRFTEVVPALLIGSAAGCFDYVALQTGDASGDLRHHPLAELRAHEERNDVEERVLLLAPPDLVGLVKAKEGGT